MDSINNAAGGGQQGEAKVRDQGIRPVQAHEIAGGLPRQGQHRTLHLFRLRMIEQGVDYAQQYAGQGDQSNEGAVEQRALTTYASSQLIR